MLDIQIKIVWFNVDLSVPLAFSTKFRSDTEWINILPTQLPSSYITSACNIQRTGKSNTLYLIKQYTIEDMGKCRCL